jgi:hypothetical protein
MYRDEDIIIKYKGSQPESDAYNQIKMLAEVLQAEAPSTSSIRMTFVDAGERGFTGTIRVRSTEGSFFAKARDETLLDLASKLIDRVRKQLQNWKGVRFLVEMEKEERRI